MPGPPTTPVTPRPTYPRPASIGSPVRNRWGVGQLSAKPGEVYIGSMAGGANKNIAVSAFDTPGSYAALSPAAQEKLYRDALSVYGHDKVPTVNMDSFLAQTAYNAYSVQRSTGLMVDPLNYWEYYRQTGGFGLDVQKRAAAAGAGGGGGGGPRTSTTVSQSVSLTDPTSARGLVDEALGKYLGRNPTEDEFAKFTKALNRAERKNRTVSKTTSVTSSGTGGTSSRTNSLTKGGLSEARFAEEWAMQQEGAAEYRTATTVLDEFMKVLGA